MVSAYALRPAWTPLTLVLMVIGFIVFWPLGLAMLAYILWGERVPEVRRHFEGVKRDWSSEHRCGRRWNATSRSGNVAFDDYRDKELKRLEEERRKLDQELRAFESFMGDLRRARDQEEFDRFMRDRADRPRKDGDTIEL
ncbi:MAG: DUF2852 domain-containing protein [Bauldia sp.]